MRTRAMAAGAATALGIVLAGCGNGADQAEPTPGGTAPGGTAGQVASCVVGDWRTSGVSAEAGDAAAVSVEGGAGVSLAVAEDGAATLDFSRMEPVTFTGEVAGSEVAGEVTYAGRATGGVRTEGQAPSGSWEPAGETNWDDVRLTIALTEPTQATPVDDAPLGDYVEQAEELTGGAVDVDPLLGEGRYECRDDTLVLSPTGGTGFTWTLARSG